MTYFKSCSALIALLWAHSAVASPPPASCKEIKNSAKRLKCYDSVSSPEAPAPLTQSAAEKKPARWTKEPVSFVGVTVDRPITESLPQLCPMDKYSSFAKIDNYQWEKAGKTPCRAVGDIAKGLGFKSGAEMIQGELVKFYQGDLVGEISAAFVAPYFGPLRSVLEERFGPPTSTRDVEVTLRNGGKIPAHVVSWVGENNTLVLSSISNSRGWGVDYGDVVFTSKKFQLVSDQEFRKAEIEKATKF